MICDPHVGHAAVNVLIMTFLLPGRALLFSFRRSPTLFNRSPNFISHSLYLSASYLLSPSTLAAFNRSLELRLTSALLVSQLGN